MPDQRDLLRAVLASPDEDAPRLVYADWLEEQGEDRKFYQGPIQIAAGYFKLEQGVPAGALKLWGMGLEKIASYRPVYLGINVDALFNLVANQRAELQATQQSAETLAFTPPTIQILC